MAIQHKSNGVLALEVSDEERSSQSPSAETVGAAVTILQRDGIVIIRNAVDIDALKCLNKVLLEKSEALAAQPGIHFNNDRSARNISQPPPYTVDLMFESVWANPFTAAISAAILGPNPRVHFANGNTALGRASGRQTVHADLGSRHLCFPFGIVANYYLIDTDETNGSTEVWVGTHRDTTIEDHDHSPGAVGGVSSIKPELVEARRAVLPPVQPAIKQGDLVLRDLRLWHAGMPNKSETARIMLAFGMFPWWYQSPLKLTLPLKSKALLESWKRKHGLDFAAEFVNEEWPDPKFRATIDSMNPAIVY
ncbi:phytanoyl-CoA dioxygenase family protein [Aspergillus tanneri]|nr:uncharacterized protein ATNIH1004_009413 [Aspergillus tanneri]KAA8645196.1 hypothetical protein ATNIH1004_009413 [Aspergillus tanneri]